MSTSIQDLIRRWDSQLLAVAGHEEEPLNWPVSETGTVLRRGADEAAVAALEARLGTTLPPSYRTFLMASDGAWAQPGWGMCGLEDPPDDEGNEQYGLGLLDTTRVAWLRDSCPSLVESWGISSTYCRSVGTSMDT